MIHSELGCLFYFIFYFLGLLSNDQNCTKMKLLSVVDFSKVLELTMAKFGSIFYVWNSSY